MIVVRPKFRSRRRLTEEMFHRATFLDEADRLLLEQVILKGAHPADVAVLIGRPFRVVQRRVRTLVARLHHPEVVFVIRQHAEWSPELRDVALSVWVRKHPLRDTARRLNLTLHGLRQRVETIRGLIRESPIGRDPWQEPRSDEEHEGEHELQPGVARSAEARDEL